MWSFGVLLWEMLTGRALFTGETVTDVIAQVMTRDADLDALPGKTPASVRKLIARCLRKDPRERLPDIGAARLEIKDVLAGSTDGAPPAPLDDSAVQRVRRRERLVWAPLAVLGFSVALIAALWPRAVPRPQPARFTVELPRGWSAGDLAWPVPSPDGKQIAFVAAPPAETGASVGQAQIWIRRLDSLDVHPLPETDGVGGIPSWSPDGKAISFFVGAELRLLNLADGTVRRICTVPVPGTTHADWNKNGTILFGSGGPIYRVEARGGEPKQVTAVDAAAGETAHYLPQFLPDGRHFLFWVLGKPERQGMYVASIDAPGQRKRVVADVMHYEYAAGHLLFARDGTLFAQPFDDTRWEPSGEPVAIMSSVANWAAFQPVGRFGVSSSGTVAAFSGSPASGPVQLAWLDRKGLKLGNVGLPDRYGQIALSPDEKTVCVEIATAASRKPNLFLGPTDVSLWLMDGARGVTSRLTNPPGLQFDPVWSPDGRSIVFAAADEEKEEIRRKGLRASDPETVLVKPPKDTAFFSESWSPDGKTLLFLRLADKRKTAWALPLAGGEPVEALHTAGERIDETQLSPDGRFVAYMSDESGRYEVYVEPWSREGVRQRVSVDGGGQPKWRGDGRELFYVTPGGMLMSVGVRVNGDQLEVGLPTRLFQIAGLATSGETDEYAPSRDGQRFLVKQPTEQEAGLTLQVLTHWTSLLETSSR